jgi:hypothetical protein
MALEIGKSYEIRGRDITLSANEVRLVINALIAEDAWLADQLENFAPDSKAYSDDHAAVNKLLNRFIMLVPEGES